MCAANFLKLVLGQFIFVTLQNMIENVVQLKIAGAVNERCGSISVIAFAIRFYFFTLLRRTIIPFLSKSLTIWLMLELNIMSFA